ncbi:beta-mannosidase [Marinifilum caeruleilacunae]|nr:glycoside hydrolase family 2 protein [Marinifilum caeruleilacunae]
MIVKDLSSDWTFSEKDSLSWLPAKVPGCVHTDLLANGKIEDPFYRLNEHDLQWIDKKDWIYKTEFELDQVILSKGRIVLDFKGLDTYADVYLNDQKVLSADNMFREWTVDVKKYLKKGKNKLHIAFYSPITKGLELHDANAFVYPGAENDQAELGQVEGNKRVSIYTRKAGYHYGWDWGPRLVSSGIWRPVYLRAWDHARIQDLQIVQNQVKENLASFTAVLELESEQEVLADIQIRNNGLELAASNVQLKKGVHKYELNFDIENPKLWWPNGLGEQDLYTINAEINVNGRVEQASRRIGIRTMEVVREKDDEGTSFYFKVNGVPVFMKGANYIPNDIFPSRVSKDQLKKVIETAKNSNMNMLRVWGGGYYEDDLFYDLCDEAGILVWQDFMFACAMYPGKREFLDNIKAEARDNIRRLRNHPSIALWCGNNEILVAWHNWGWKRQAREQGEEVPAMVWKAYADIFHEVLPKAVEEYDPSRFYWSSSPSSGTGVKPDLINGDDHYWGVWWGKEPFETYATHIARFMSEYGFQSFPEMKSVRKYAEPEDCDIFSEVMKSHQRSSIGNETIEYYMLQDYRKPKDFESFLYVNHVLQAEGIKFALEGHRRAMPYCMGSLYWQINDCWPVASWSSTDYYQEWKALQYYVKKGFEPLLVSPYLEKDNLKVAVVNDHLKEIDAKLILKVMDFTGNVTWSESKEISIRKNSSEVFYGQQLKKFLQGRNPEKELFLVELKVDSEVVARNILYFKSVKDVKLPKPKVEYSILKKENSYEIRIESDVLAKNVFLSLGDEDGFFSDNYFDVLAGETISIRLETEISLEKLNEVIQLRTLDSTFE